MAITHASRLKGVHPDLVRVIERAGKDADFMVIEGVRSLARQKELVKAGASKTLHSRHLTGHAVDIAPLIRGKLCWSWDVFHALAPVIKAAAKAEGVTVTWGGDWKNFPDGPHWELPK